MIKKPFSIGDLNRGHHLPENVRRKLSAKRKHMIQEGKLTMPVKAGDTLSKEHKAKISATMRKLYKDGKLKLPNNKGSIPWSKGKTFSVEHRQNISKGRKGISPWNKSKKLSEAHKHAISIAKKNRKERKETI